jgi:hypothetical protein
MKGFRFDVGGNAGAGAGVFWSEDPPDSGRGAEALDGTSGGRLVGGGAGIMVERAMDGGSLGTAVEAANGGRAVGAGKVVGAVAGTSVCTVAGVACEADGTGEPTG